MSALLALLSSALWGMADYAGGRATRRRPVGAVLFASQALGLLLVLIAVAGAGGLRGPRAGETWQWWGASAGLVGAAALAAFYRALALGTMGVVAPIAAAGVIVPVLFGLLIGERPRALQAVGGCAAIAGVLLASRPADAGSPRSAADRHSLVLALGAAVGFGWVIVCISRGSRQDLGMALLVQRVVSVAAVGAVLAGLAHSRRPGRSLATDTGRWSGWRVAAGFVLLAGLGDAGANAAYAQASRGGLVSVVAVLASLYPVVTVLLARQLDRERLARAQAVGVASALVGVILLAAG